MVDELADRSDDGAQSTRSAAAPQPASATPRSPTNRRDDTGTDAPFDPDAIDDDKLALIVTPCYPILSKESRVALTLGW